MSLGHLQVHRKAWEEISPAERAAWNRLLGSSSSSRWAFLSPAYAQAVHAAMGDVEVLLVYRQGVMVGVMAVQRAVGLLGRLGLREPLGREMSDYFGLLAEPSVKISWDALLRAAKLPCLYFTHLDEGQLQHGLTGGSPRKGLRTRIDPQGGHAHWEWLRAHNKKLVSDTERRERKLVGELGPLQFQMHSTSARQDLRALVDMKNAQYRRTGKEEGALLNPRNVLLLERLMEQTDNEHCLPRLSVLKSGERLVAAHFGLQCGPLLHYWFPVYDSSLAAFSPGRILFRHLLLASQDHGIRCVDRGEGDSAAKRDFATEEHHYVKGLPSAGGYGHLIAGLQKVAWRMR